MSSLELAHVTKSYGSQPVLDEFELAVTDGTITAILGPSGSGKTTLLRLVAGFDPIDSGSIRIGDRVVDDGARRLAPEHRQLGYVPQEGALFPHLDVAANVGFGLPRAARRGKVAELLEMVGLAGLDRRYPDQLSGGQQQRVALARALAVDPQLVLLDEPFSALDPTLRASIRAEVLDILREARATTLLVTHDQDEALSSADEVAVIRAGKVVQHAPPHDLYSAPVDVELARFLGEANLFEVEIVGRTAMTPLGEVTVRRPSNRPTDSATNAAARRGTVMLRPEQIEVQAGDEGLGVAATVVHAEFHGHSTMVQLALDDLPDSAHLHARYDGSKPIGPGSHVRVSAGGPALAWE